MGTEATLAGAERDAGRRRASDTQASEPAERETGSRDAARARNGQ